MTRAHWSLTDIDWSRLRPELVAPDLLETIKTAALVEANSADYVTYLRNVFQGDGSFEQAALNWGSEEAQHGAALAEWAKRIDPAFDFAACLARFRAGYRLPLDTDNSVRGSRSGELIARCVVESGTCSFYSALRDSSAEPVLRQICHLIAQDEAAHYRLFYTHLRRYLPSQPLGLWARLRIAWGRVAETSDDELAYAYFSANGPAGMAYRRAECAAAYWQRSMSRYSRRHVQGAAHMILNAVALNPRSWWARLGIAGVWHALRWKLRAAA